MPAEPVDVLDERDEDEFDEAGALEAGADDAPVVELDDELAELDELFGGLDAATLAGV